jgi:hypothetical protein
MAFLSTSVRGEAAKESPATTPTTSESPSSAKSDATLQLAQLPAKESDLPSPLTPEAAVNEQASSPSLSEYFAENLRFSGRLPDYVYDASYYDSTGIGANPIADYAPDGYEAREFQDAPGSPEFSPIFPPVRISDEERAKFVTRGIMPGSFLVPATNTSFRLRGFVRLTGMYDFNPIGSRDDFVTNTIPVPQRDGENQNISARYSRIALDTWTPTPFKEWNAHTFIEFDFFSGPNQGVGGSSPARLRFAFVDFGYFRFGQQNTVFMDGNAFPSTVDFAGPRGLANLRRPTARMTLPLCERLYWATAIESPFSDITTSNQGDNVQDIPDFANHLRYETNYGHVQVANIVRSIGFRQTAGDTTRRTAWGISSSTVFHPWAALMKTDPVTTENPTGLQRSRILLQHTTGYGIGRYIQDAAGLGLDGQVDPVTGSFDTVYAVGWTASYEHWFNAKWLSNTTYSEAYTGQNGDQPAGTYSGGKYLATSIWWIPIRNMSIGTEYVWGERQNVDTQRAHANRIQMLFQYNF